jgi:hypothetical protein
MKEKLIADGCASLFQPDSLLPSQFFAALKQKTQAYGERRLMIAILEDAVECFQKHFWATAGRGRQLRAEAEKWILSDDSSWPFSFVNICEVLEIHPQFLRDGLITWKAQQLALRQATLSRRGTKADFGSEPNPLPVVNETS